MTCDVCCALVVNIYCHTSHSIVILFILFFAAFSSLCFGIFVLMLHHQNCLIVQTVGLAFASSPPSSSSSSSSFPSVLLWPRTSYAMSEPHANTTIIQTIYNSKTVPKTHFVTHLFSFNYIQSPTITSLQVCELLENPSAETLSVFLNHPFASDANGPSHITPHTSHITPHTSHITPHTSHITPHTSFTSSALSSSSSAACVLQAIFHYSLAPLDL